MALAPRWLRARIGVRVASALAAAAVVAIALLVGGAALVLLVDRSLTHSVQDDAVQRAEAIADRMHGNYGRRVDPDGDGGRPVYTPKENAVEALDALARGDDQIAQILVDYTRHDTGVYTLTRTSSAATDAVMSSLRPRPGQVMVDDSVLVKGEDGWTHHAVVAAVGGTTTTSPSANYVVLYAGLLRPVDAARDTVLKGLLLGVPMLILIAGAATYVFAGRALRPVEAMRTRVSEMSEKDLSQRVPVPPTRDEIGRLAETMNGMIARLEHAQGQQRRFVADASHELRSPLATIRAGLELMHAGGADDASTLGALQRETERIGRLVDDLLLLARADERGMRPRRDEVDLDDVAEAERSRPTDGSVATEVHAEPVRIIGDRSQLVRVLRNLVDNARRHARSRVLVTVTREHDVAVLSVADDGPGVPAADRERVFERFVRLDDARARTDGGSGLGLAIVSEVVAAHGGAVTVGDAPGGGALFQVRLPAVVLPPLDELPEDELPEDEAAVDGVRVDGVRVSGAAARVDGVRVNGAGARANGARVDGAQVDGAQVDGAQVDGAQVDGVRVDGARVDETPVGGAEVGAAPVGGAEVGGAQVGEVPGGEVPGAAEAGHAGASTGGVPLESAGRNGSVRGAGRNGGRVSNGRVSNGGRVRNGVPAARTPVEGDRPGAARTPGAPTADRSGAVEVPAGRTPTPAGGLPYGGKAAVEAGSGPDRAGAAGRTGEPSAGGDPADVPPTLRLPVVGPRGVDVVGGGAGSGVVGSATAGSGAVRADAAGSGSVGSPAGSASAAGGDDPARDDPARDDPARDDPARDDPARDDPARDDPARDDPARDDPARDDPAHDDPGGDDPARDDPAHDDPGGDDPHGSGASTVPPVPARRSTTDRPRPAPVTDVEARRDPLTTPWGFPRVEQGAQSGSTIR